MLTPAERPFAVVATGDQWVRSLHEHTAVVGGCVQLALRDVRPTGVDDAGPPPRAGLAFDVACHLYRAVPADGTIVRDGRPLVAPPVQPVGGDFTSTETRPVPRQRPRALAATADGLLHAAGPQEVQTIDPGDGRVLRRVTVPGRRGEPLPVLDLAARAADLWVLAGPPFRLARLSGGAALVVLRLPRPARPVRRRRPMALDLLPDGRPVILLRTPGGDARVAIAGHRALLEPAGLTGATDLAVDGQGRIVVAGHPGESMAVIAERDGLFGTEPPLDAYGYTGDGIVVTPAGRVAFWTARGLVVAAAARARLRTEGHVTTYRLDAGRPGETWGRLFVDACVPEGASLRVQTVTTDEDRTGADAPAWVPPPGSDTSWLDPAVTPPQLPAVDDVRLRDAVPAAMHRRDRGPELPWVPADPGGFRTYEAPVQTRPGRFLWVRLVLAGTGRVTPRVRTLRAERPGHDLLRQLPRSWSRDEDAAAFLRRYLAPLDGELAALGALAAARHLLVDPRTTPDDALEWLAGFVGLTLDRRVPVERQRALVAEAAWLFARRGTVPGLRRMIELAIGADVVLVERFRLRGLELDSFARTAHRFTVIVPGVLDGDQRGVLETLLDTHRPAHTVVDMCTAAGGSRVGLGLHLGLSAVVGPTGGFTPLVLGQGAIGRDRTLGEASGGVRPGGATLGTARLGWGR